MLLFILFCHIFPMSVHVSGGNKSSGKTEKKKEQQCFPTLLEALLQGRGIFFLLLILAPYLPYFYCHCCCRTVWVPEINRTEKRKKKEKWKLSLHIYLWLLGKQRTSLEFYLCWYLVPSFRLYCIHTGGCWTHHHFGGPLRSGLLLLLSATTYFFRVPK